ncbi:MAG TPA: hypothetical protein VK196_14090 [Magnetospirillum sp.]|nr:hypothetical protein [Magnetospirillum sp.]
MTALVFAYTIMVTAFDLFAAWVYAQGGADLEIVTAFRVVRDGLAAALGLWGLAHVRRNPMAGLAMAAYALFIVVYAVFSEARMDSALVNASIVRLALPAVLVMIGMGGLNDEKALTRYAVLVAGLSCVSAVFGVWDIRHTEFWTDTLEYGYYLHDVKGITTGFDSRWLLPFNFFGYEYQRRAAGLVAAPLAQGSLLAVGAVLGYAALGRKYLPVAGLVLALCLLGVWQSGTRGAFLMVALALPIYMLGGNRENGAMVRNLAIMALIAGSAYETLAYVVSYSVSYADGSTIGHVDALARNLENLDEVLLMGKGIGMAGTDTSSAGQEIAGGGEGALFSVIYQLGLPGGIAFLAFYIVCAMAALKRARGMSGGHDIALATFALTVGLATSMIISEHLFSLSATAPFWIVLGGVLGLPLKKPEAKAAP